MCVCVCVCVCVHIHTAILWHADTYAQQCKYACITNGYKLVDVSFKQIELDLNVINMFTHDIQLGESKSTQLCILKFGNYLLGCYQHNYYCIAM